MNKYNIWMETLINIFIIDDAKIKILLMRKKDDPYKGYWILPGERLNNQDTLENNITDVVYDKLGLTSVQIEQNYTFSATDRDPNNRIVATSFIGLTDSKTVELKREERKNIETIWFPIDDLPKLGYDHEFVIVKAIESLKKRITNSNVLKTLFPSDFTLPELQKVFEIVLDSNLDRRNFRKKFLNLDMIEETGDKTEGSSGRPAKLYRFKDDIKDAVLF